MSTEIAWGHTTTQKTLPPQVLTILMTPYSGERGTRMAGVRPSAGGEWTVFATGPDAPSESTITDRRTETRLEDGDEVEVEAGGIEVRFGMRPPAE